MLGKVKTRAVYSFWDTRASEKACVYVETRYYVMSILEVEWSFMFYWQIC